jgi:hypothetical protein
MFAMSLKLKLLLFADSNASPLLSKGIHIVDWPFQFFDVERRCMIKCKLEGLNTISLDVYV